MQAVILAAGMGSRLGKYTSNSTKCMVKVEGKSLLERIFDSLRSVNIKDVTIITGYCSEKLIEHALEIGDDLDIEFINNKRFKTTNNIYSLYLASEKMKKDDTLLFESDLIFDLSIISDIVNNSYPDLVAVSRFENWMDGTVTTFDENKNVTSFIDKSHFKWDECEQYYKTVNIYKLSKEFFSQWYSPFLNAYIRTCGNNAYYEMVLKVINNITGSSLKAIDITGKKWYEIDTPQDLQVAQTLFGKDKMKNLSERYGGYWRFKTLHDYCYLVNPWFPNQEMINELKYNFELLLTQYPSGSKVILTAMSSLFEINEEYVSVGNGASEIIRVIMKNISGSVYITYPSFNEYINSLDNEKTNVISSVPKKFKYDSEFILANSSEANIIIIINPDNPSGNFISKSEMIKILDYSLDNNKKVIVDESFVDFADNEQRYTLLKNDILEKYPNLIVIKSISKSYGVPGLRLGVLCSSDREVISMIKKELPIWNINSFAEYFLQIIGKYKNEYFSACNKLAEERIRFTKKLESTGKFVVYPSQANYILCKVINGTSKSIAEYLLQNDFLIKDLSDKVGCSNGEYIRIAIRTKEENDELIEVIKKYEYV